MKMTKLRGFAGALVAAILLTQTVCYAREVDHLMDEIKNVISTGIAESTQSTGMMIHSVRNTGRELALGHARAANAAAPMPSERLLLALPAPVAFPSPRSLHSPRRPLLLARLGR